MHEKLIEIEIKPQRHKSGLCVTKYRLCVIATWQRHSCLTTRTTSTKIKLQFTGKFISGSFELFQRNCVHNDHYDFKQITHKTKSLNLSLLFTPVL